MPERPPLHLALSIAVLTLCLLSCGSDEPASKSDWMIQEEALSLERDLLVSEGESFYFGTILDVAPAGDGRIYVADADAGHVKVLSPDGTLLDSLGRKGEGPGEFQRLTQLAVARDDSLYVIDSQRRRVSVFAPSGQLARDLSVDPGQMGFPRGLMVPEKRSGLVLQHATFALSGEAERGTYVIRRLRPDGSVADTLVTKRRSPSHQAQREDVKLLIPIPFMPSLHAALGPNNRVHVARGDSLAVVSYALDGEPRREVSTPFEPVPVTDEDKDRVLKNYSDERPMPQDKIPEMKPAFTDFLVDDEGRYWFGRPTVNPDSTDWWVAWPDEQRVVTTTLPSEVQLHEIVNGRAYGQTTTDTGAPALVRYQIRFSD
jgi:hypothetical protein